MPVLRITAIQRRSYVYTLGSHMNQVFCFRLTGRNHEWGNKDCNGCEHFVDKPFPRPHVVYGSTCPGLVHAGVLVNALNNLTEMVVQCDTCGCKPSTSLENQ